MTREETDFIGSMNMCDEISNEAYKKIMCHCEEQEPCTDAISRKAAIDAGWNLNLETSYDNEKVEEMLKDLPPVNPQPKTGHWIETGAEELPFGVTIPELTCSTCGWSNGLIIPRNYCPKCGTKMEERGKNDN